MIEDYLSGDPYINIGKRLGYVPMDATKQSHPAERDKLKIVNFCLVYGATQETLGAGLQVDKVDASNYMIRLKKVYERVFKWQKVILDRAYESRTMSVAGGWRVKLGRGVADSQIKNWIIQATGAEVLRTSVINLLCNNLKVVALVHDSVILMLDKMEDLDKAKKIMEISAMDVAGIKIRVGAKITNDRFIPDPTSWNKFLEKYCGRIL